MPLETIITQTVIDATRNPVDAQAFLDCGNLSTSQQLFLVGETNANRELVQTLIKTLNQFSDDRELLIKTTRTIIETKAESVPFSWIELAQEDSEKAARIYRGAFDLIRSMAELSKKGINPLDFISNKRKK